jgi:tRNA(adenine34) deaminase
VAGSAYDAAMRRALAEGHAALATGDVPVGAVVLDPAGEVLAVGHNAREAEADPTGHAEIVAMRSAAQTLGTWRLEGCTLVVTLEPCTMCAGALVLARVARLVYGATDPKAGAVASLWDVVRDRRLNHRPEVVGGVLAAECAEPLREFFAAHRGADEVR